MQFDQIVLQLGDRAYSLLELIVAGGVLALILLFLAVVLAWRAQRNGRVESEMALDRAAELEIQLAELTGQLRGLAEQTQGVQSNLARTLEDRLDQVSHRLGLGLSDQTERTHQSLSQLNERLAVIDAAQKNLATLSSEMITLKDVLANKQARGAYGQARMEAIIRDGLHASAYSFQTTLTNGSRPDCLIRLPDSELRLVIDSKFPLEAFNALKAASGAAEIKAAEARLRADVLKHIKDVAEKYLIAGETHETAIMFVPSESIYAELYERFEDMIQKAHRAQVIVASPNVLMLLIQTMQAIFKDARMREQAGVIKIEVARLLEDVGRLKERVSDLQRHFGAANADLDRLNVSAEKVVKRGLRIESLDLQEQLSANPAETAGPRLVERR